MEGLGIAANIIAVVDLSTKLVGRCVQYASDVKNSNNDKARLLRQVTALNYISTKAKDLLDGPYGTKLQASIELPLAIKDSHLQLQMLQGKLALGPKSSYHALKWPFQSKEVERAIQELEKCRQTISLALQIDQTALILDFDRKIVLDRLDIANGASFDSHAQEHNPTCLPKTRVELLQQIRDWTKDASARSIFWLNGMAGTGKSTICRSVATSFATQGSLGASFFFKRGEADRGSLAKFFATVAADLIRRQPATALHIKHALDNDPAITTRNTREQYKQLFLEPLLKADVKEAPLVIAIDALDECDRDSDIKLIIELFSQAAAELSGRIRIFLTSRPELPLRLGFREIEDSYQDVILHEMPKPVVEHDISVFLKHELARIRNEYNNSTEHHLSEDWPGLPAVNTLVKRAVPLFIVAATICRFIGDRQIATPQRQLDKILSQMADEASQLGSVYLSVLNSQISELSNTNKQEEVLQEFRKVVGTIVFLASPLSINALAGILDMPREDIDNRLAFLHSVLSVPSLKEPVRLLHLSFRDFLVDSGRPANSFWIDKTQVHTDMAQNCLRILGCLKQDLCCIGAPGTPRSAISTERINACLPSEVQYACQYWVHHIEEAGLSISDESEAYSFLKRHFLHWIEGLAFIGRALDSLSLINTLQSRLMPQNSAELSELLDDATRFLRTYISAINLTPLQLYFSMLIFTPTSSNIRTLFEDKAKWIRLMPKIEDTWSECLQTLEGHGGWVQSVAFSHDSALVASASEDGTVRIWRSDTGECLQTLEGHSGPVCSVAFSHDSALMASASHDETVRIWRSDTGECLQTLKGHSSRVYSVAFSHDSALMVSASLDETVRIWHSDTGECLQTVKGYSGWVWSIAFSHDSALVASAPPNGTVRIWRRDTGECLQTLEGHVGRVQSMAFSHDSALMASASSDKTVRIWRSDTGECLQKLKGHGGWVWSVAFSHDSALIASASHDGTVRIWRSNTGECLQTLKGHGGWVQSVAFSHDSALVASASLDKTVRIWRSDTGKCLQTVKGYGGWVQSVAFSHNSAFVASASEDRTVRIWRSDTGECLQTLKGHNSPVQSIAFSHDLILIVSASEDQTVRIWLSDTGECLQTLEGHSSWVYCVAFSHNSALIASASEDKTVRIWRSDTGECLQTLEAHGGPVCSVAFSHDSALIASASSDKTVRIWRSDTGECLQTLKGHGGRVQSVAFSHDSALMASASEDKTVRIWRSDTGECLQIIDLGIISQHLSFSTNTLYLQTDIGSITLHYIDNTSTLMSSKGTVSATFSGYGISLDRCWITWNGNNILWLPVEFRPVCSAVLESTIALGLSSGKVTIIGFPSDYSTGCP